jgi:hypothetical protein
MNQELVTLDVRILETIQQSSMASTWTEHLCIHRTPDGKWCLDIRGYEVVGETNEFEDENGDLPNQIDGKEVVGTEDEYVVVDHLVPHSDSYSEYVFERFDADEFEKCFTPDNAEWCSDETKHKIRRAILNYGVTC